jgi:hypothetical protein
MSADIHIDEDNSADTKPSVFVRVAIIIGILIILFLIAIAIVRFVPRFISSLGQANVSLTSLFSGNSNATTTPAATNNTQNNQYPVNNQPLATTTSNNNQGSYNNAPTQNTSTGSSRPTYTYPSNPTYYPATPADLSISLVKVARLAPDGSLQDTRNFFAGDRVTVQFKVTNIGGSASGAWTLSARLPTTIPSEQNYVSGAEPSIPRGASYLMTMAFDAFDPNQSSIQIGVNAADASTANNILTIPVSGTYNGGNNQNGCYYQNGQYICNGNNNNNGYYNNYNCYWSNGSYICNNQNGSYNNNNNLGSCYVNGQYICGGNYNSNNGCYYQNGYQVCSNTQSGYADLDVRIITTGQVDRNTGQFMSTNTVTRNDRAGVQIEIRNTGSVVSNPWSLTASLSGNGSSSTYSSGVQSAIQPGQSQVIVATFDNPTAGYQTVSVSATQTNNSYESNTGNNYANQGINISN